jgi:hypothetical protein
MKPYTAALTACMRSGDAELRGMALRRIEALFAEHDGNLLRAARASGISHRTLCRWVETDVALQDLLRQARDMNVIAKTPDKTSKP